MKESTFTIAMNCFSPLFFQLALIGRVRTVESFSLDRSSGKKCFMISARELYIEWGNDNRYWNWVSLPDSRFSEVAELHQVCWLEIRGAIKASELSPCTYYAAYFILKYNAYSYGFQTHQTELGISVSDGSRSSKRKAFIHDKHYRIAEPFPAFGVRPLRPIRFIPREYLMNMQSFQLPQSELRPRQGGDDGEWMEVEIGEFYVSGDEDGAKVEFSMMEVDGGEWKIGMVVEGIEIRPKTRSA